MQYLRVVIEFDAGGAAAAPIASDAVEHAEARDDIVGDRAHGVRRAEADHVGLDLGFGIEAIRRNVLDVLQ